MLLLRYAICFVILCRMPVSAWAQTEICSNGIDDDHDGLCDANDPDCGSCTFWPVFQDLGGGSFTAPVSWGGDMTVICTNGATALPTTLYNYGSLISGVFCPVPLVSTKSPPN